MQTLPNHYPAARRADQIDDYHGTPIADPYRWLEDPDAAETADFVRAQAALTDRFLAAVPARAAMRDRLQTLIDYERTYSVQKQAGQIVYQYNSGLQNQPLIYSQAGVDAAPTLLLDPNALSADGTSAVTGFQLSPDGRYLAYVLTHGGSDWQEIHLRDLQTGRDLHDERIPHVRFASIVWHPDGSGFYYNGHPDPTGLPSASANLNNRVCWHALGTPAAADRVVHAHPYAPEHNFPLRLTDDGQFMVSHIWFTTERRNYLYYGTLADGGRLQPLVGEADAEYVYVGNVGRIFYVATDLAAPNRRVVAIDLDNPARDQWRTVVAEGSDALDLTVLVNGELVLVYLRDASHSIVRVALDGTPLGTLALPTFGSVLGLAGRADEPDLFVEFHSFLYPLCVLHAPTTDQPLQTWRAPAIDFPFERYETVLAYATSRDGTAVPLFITRARDLPRDGTHPTLLYGYGGFAVNLTPRFSASRLQWLELGGVFAQAVLRGGSEYGEAWHHAGMLAHKQNVFDDFIAAAEALVAAGYTTPQRLAIQGGSNGGLLVAACMIQRPDLFGAVICQVPVIDMLRYHQFTAGRYWVPEYGSADDPAQLPFLRAYSPLHNVRADVAYPPILILTADRDDRVVPMHAHKFAATLQAVAAPGSLENRPILLRFEFEAGHGFGKSTAKLIDEVADIHAFLAYTFDLSPAH